MKLDKWLLYLHTCRIMGCTCNSYVHVHVTMKLDKWLVCTCTCTCTCKHYETKTSDSYVHVHINYETRQVTPILFIYNCRFSFGEEDWSQSTKEVRGCPYSHC